MKYTLSLLFFLTFLFSSAQQTLYKTIQHNGGAREYILYVPASYTVGTEVPLLMNFHGYTSNATQQIVYGDFRSIADTAGFLLLCPNGMLDTLNNSHWNVGFGNSSVDDVGFVSALMDTIFSDYSINQDRVYATGMSNGGFFSYRLACELGDRVAAIASVTGSMTMNQIANCSPVHPTPVMQIHGTNDNTVDYNGGGSLNFSPVEDVVDYWVTFNGCNAVPDSLNLPNTSVTDGSTVTHYLYSNGGNNSTVEFYKVINGGHTWPGSSIPLSGTNQDFSASKEIWRFFNQYSLDNLVGVEQAKLETIKIYPNPTESSIYIDVEEGGVNEIKVFSVNGVEVMTCPFAHKVDVSGLKSGVYFLKITDFNSPLVKFVKR